MLSQGQHVLYMNQQGQSFRAVVISVDLSNSPTSYLIQMGTETERFVEVERTRLTPISDSGSILNLSAAVQEASGLPSAGQGNTEASATEGGAEVSRKAHSREEPFVLDLARKLEYNVPPYMSLFQLATQVLGVRWDHVSKDAS